jgi:pimeloyl-ACP methyl ester carboxylesterase
MIQLRYTLRRLIPASAMACCAAAALSGCLTEPYAEGTVGQLLDQEPRARDMSYAAGGRRIHYVEQVGGQDRIVFIHGAPGDWQGWAAYLRDRTLAARATLIAVDRPGWGQSAPGGVVPDLGRQAELLRPLLDGATGRTVLVAHSFGGAVAAQMALDFPGKIDGLVLIAPTLSPALSGPRWYDVVADSIPIRFLLPDRLRLAYIELAPLPDELRRMCSRWAELHLPIALIQGDDDVQVDPRNADFAQAEFPTGLVQVTRVTGQGHWIPWTRPRLIAAAIRKVLSRAGPSAQATPKSLQQI